MFLYLNFKRLFQSSRKEKESCCLVFTSTIKREIRHFHVVVVQQQQRNVQKSVMHVRSCCFANLNLYATCTSPIMHFICPPPQILHNLCFSFLLGITAVPREIENNAYTKFWGANKVEMCKWRIAFSCPRFRRRRRCLSSFLLGEGGMKGGAQSQSKNCYQGESPT